MLKQIVAKWCGLDQELSRLEKLIRELGWDECFGMYTRAAFLRLGERQPRGKRVLVFLDFDRIHELNQQLGYEEVNRRIRMLFTEGIRKSDIASRWFSGDEIAMLLDTADLQKGELVMQKLQEHARQLGLSFTYASALWKTGTDLQAALNQLSGTVMERKAKRAA